LDIADLVRAESEKYQNKGPIGSHSLNLIHAAGPSELSNRILRL